MVNCCMTIWLASGNKHKQQELAAILKDHTLKLPSEAGIDIFDPAETGAAFADNALIKAEALYRMLHTIYPDKFYAVLADDSGLCIDALGGKPGIYSARYYGKNSWAGDGSFLVKSNAEKHADHERNALLLEELEAVLAASSGTPPVQSAADRIRSCRFVCAMVLFFNPNRFYLVQETMEGEIISSAAEIRGHGGFGYDPIVYINELGRTVAELSEEEKNHYSHRGKAGRAVAALLTNYNIL